MTDIERESVDAPENSKTQQQYHASKNSFFTAHLYNISIDI